jgi:hypothetical protein
MDGATFVIEPNRTVTENGVRHEIDVFVEVAMANGYKAVFIFECKNRQVAVSKNDVIVFSEKIRAVSAATGFFVAKRFGNPARAQAEQDQRITLLEVTETSHPNIQVLPHFHYQFRKDVKSAVRLIRRGAPEDAPVNPLDAQKTCQVYGKEIILGEFAQRLVTQAMESRERDWNTTFLHGSYERTAELTERFDSGQLIVDDVDIGCIEIQTAYTAIVSQPRIVSYFDVKTRGRAVTIDFPLVPAEGAIGLFLAAPHAMESASETDLPPATE